MRVQHIQMALVHRDIGGFANRAAGMVQPFGHIAQLHKVAEIFNRGIAPPAIGIAHKGRAINWGQHQIAPTDLYIAQGVAGVLGKAAGGCGTQLARQTARDMHPLALYISASLTPALQGGRVFNKIHANLFQNGFGVPFDDLQRFFVQNLEVRDIAFDELGRFKADRCPFGPPCGPTTAPHPAPCTCIAHDPSPESLALYGGNGARKGLCLRRLRSKTDMGLDRKRPI